MPSNKIIKGPFATAVKPLTKKEARAKKRKATYAKYAAAEVEYDRLRSGGRAKSKPTTGPPPTAAQTRTKKASELRAKITKGTIFERLARFLSPAQPPKPPERKR